MEKCKLWKNLRSAQCNSGTKRGPPIYVDWYLQHLQTSVHLSDDYPKPVQHPRPITLNYQTLNIRNSTLQKTNSIYLIITKNSITNKKRAKYWPACGCTEVFAVTLSSEFSRHPLAPGLMKPEHAHQPSCISALHPIATQVVEASKTNRQHHSWYICGSWQTS
jgi:hypothetical protein